MNGENLVFIYSPQDSGREKLWCSKLAQELSRDGVEVLTDFSERVNNHIYRIINLWSHVVVLVCSPDYLDQYLNNQSISQNELFGENFDMGRLIICLRDSFGSEFSNVTKNVVPPDLASGVDNSAKISDVKEKISNILNAKKSDYR